MTMTLTQDSKRAAHLDLPRSDVGELSHRADNIHRYIETEIQLRSRQKGKDIEGSYQHKWRTLHDDAYLKHMSENPLEIDWTLSQRLHAFAQHLHAASNPACNDSIRWLHCMICSHHMCAARIAAENGSALYNSDMELNELGFTIENYVTELDIVRNTLLDKG